MFGPQCERDQTDNSKINSTCQKKKETDQRQITVYITQQWKLKTEQHEAHSKQGLISGSVSKTCYFSYLTIYIRADNRNFIFSNCRYIFYALWSLDKRLLQQFIKEIITLKVRTVKWKLRESPYLLYVKDTLVDFEKRVG